MDIFAMVAVLAANVDSGRFGRDSGSSDHNTRDPDQVRDIGGIEIANGDVRCGRVQEKLVRGESDIPLAGVDDSSSAVLECRLELLGG